MLFVGFLARSAVPACQPTMAAGMAAFATHATAIAVLQAHPAHLETHRTACIAAVRLSYAAAWAAFGPSCRAEEYYTCAPPPTFARFFVVDTGQVVLLFQSFAFPLPFRAHALVAAATACVIVVLNNQGTCDMLGRTCRASWFEFQAGPSGQGSGHHKLAKWLLTAARPILSRPLQFGTVQACWCCMLFAQVVAGLVLPSCVVYMLEEAARRRHLAAWHRRHQAQRQQALLALLQQQRRREQ